MRLRDENGTSVELSKVLGKGGEAEVWAVPTHAASVAKIYHVPSTEHEAKLRAMVAQPPVDPTRSRGHVSICWPEALLFEPTGKKNVGFLMPRIDVSQHRELFKIYNARTRQTEAPDFTWAYLLTAAENIANVIDSIHTKGYVVGDMNESNFFISSQALATIVDCDSMQVTTGSGVFRCTVAKPEYMAPELQGKDLSKEIRTGAQDNFALAVLIFHLLMEGFHPYSGKWDTVGEAPSIEERISRGDSPYGGSSRISPSPGAPPFEILPGPVREMFVRAFYGGNRDPAKRPSAKEWQVALHRLGTELSTCKANAQHLYSRHLSRCPWCERAVLLRGFDPFPSPAAQKALPHRPFGQRGAAGAQAGARGGATAASASAANPHRTMGRAVSAGRGPYHAVLANRTGFRMLLFVVPFVAAAVGILLVPEFGSKAIPMVRNTWILAVGLGVARRIQIRDFGRALLFFLGWVIAYLLGANVLGAPTALGTALASLAEAMLAFSASRSLLAMLRVRLDIYRGMGRTGRIAAVLAASVGLAPLAALGTGVASLANGRWMSLPGWAAVRGPAAAGGWAAGSQPVTLLTCASLPGRCGCAAKNTFRRGETVDLLASSSGVTPRLEIQVEPSGQPPVRLNVSPWRANGAKHCATSQYKISGNAEEGFAHVHVAVNGERSETGFSVVP